MESKWWEILVEVLYLLGKQARNSGRHEGGLMPLLRQFSQLLWCKVCLDSDELFYRNIYWTIPMPHRWYGIKVKRDSCWSTIFICWASTQFRAARWRTSISWIDKFFCIDSWNSLKIWRALLGKQGLTTFKFSWPIAINPRIKGSQMFMFPTVTVLINQGGMVAD